LRYLIHRVCFLSGQPLGVGPRHTEKSIINLVGFLFVIPAEAGIQTPVSWIPASAGMTLDLSLV